MATPILSPDVYWRLDPASGQVDIISHGTILETVPWQDAPSRLNHHRREAARVCVQTAPAPVDWRADGTPITKRARRAR